MRVEIESTILLFFACACLGWVMEVICQLVQLRRFINRGFLLGPYCPIYGFGAVLICRLLSRFSGDPLAVFALALCLLQTYLPLICKNKVLFNFLAAFCVGSLIGLACRALPALHGDKIIIGDIMLLIPGLAFTNAVKDVFIGDTISGVMRLIETVLWAAALALGFALSGWLLGV